MEDVDVLATYSSPQPAIDHALEMCVDSICGGTAARPLIVVDLDQTLVEHKETPPDAPVPIEPVVALIRALHALGATLHLLTARLDNAVTRDVTRRELAALKLHDTFDSVTLAPPEARATFAAVAEWKQRERLRLAREHGAPIVLSVGDNWSDLMPVAREADLRALDHATGPATHPYRIVCSCGGVGLKLPTTAVR
jgi:hypothetical protein